MGWRASPPECQGKFALKLEEKALLIHGWKGADIRGLCRRPFHGLTRADCRTTGLQTIVTGGHGDKPRILLCDAVLATQTCRQIEITGYVLETEVVSISIVDARPARKLGGLSQAPSA